MKKRLVSLMLKAVLITPLMFFGSTLAANAAGDDVPVYTIMFDYELGSGASDQLQLSFNQRTNNNGNDYLNWIFTNDGLTTRKRGSYTVIITAYRWNTLNSTSYSNGLVPLGSIASVKIDVFSTYIETYVNGVLVDNTTFAQINATDIRNGAFSANATSQIGLIATTGMGDNYIDNLIVIDYPGGAPTLKYYADFETVNPFGSYGLLNNGRLKTNGMSNNDTTNRWTNLGDMAPPPGATILEILYNQYVGYLEADYKSWSWPRFAAAMTVADAVLNDAGATPAQKLAAQNELVEARKFLSGINDVLNLNNDDPFCPSGMVNLVLGKGSPILNFGDATPLGWITNRNNCTTAIENGVLRVNVTGGDPHFPFQLPDNMRFSADEYRYVKISMKNTSSATLSQFFFGTNLSPGPLGPDNTNFAVSANDTEFKTYIVDMIDDCVTPGYWTGTVQTFRWDPIEGDGAVNGAVVYCEYIAFFKTREAAEAFELAAASVTDGLVGGSPSNDWQGKDATDNEIVVDLGGVFTIGEVALFPRQDNQTPINSAPGFPLEYTIEFSTDGANYSGAINVTGKTSASVLADPQFSALASPIAARYVRVNMTALQPGKQH